MKKNLHLIVTTLKLHIPVKRNLRSLRLPYQQLMGTHCLNHLCSVYARVKFISNLNTSLCYVVLCLVLVCAKLYGTKMEEIISIIKKCTPNLSWRRADSINTTEDPSANQQFWDLQARNKLSPDLFGSRFKSTFHLLGIKSKENQLQSSLLCQHPFV